MFWPIFNQNMNFSFHGITQHGNLMPLLVKQVIEAVRLSTWLTTDVAT